jgi:diacylglycerol diphosphate phosphatase / phosphatidate phosphatase
MPLPSCLRSHGAKVARRHMVDWIVLLLLIAMEVLLNKIEPFHRFVGDQMMETLRYPLKHNTVPVWAVGVCTPSPPRLNHSSSGSLLRCRKCCIRPSSCLVLQVLAVLGPIIIITGIYIIKRNVYDLHHAILGKFLACAPVSHQTHPSPTTQSGRSSA